MKRKWMILAAAMIACTLWVTGCGSDTTEKDASAPVEEVKITNEENVSPNYDCIVVDGSPEGITAAISAARKGLDTLLICQDDALGGLYTLGELNYIDVPESRDGTVLVEGIYKEFSDAVARVLTSPLQRTPFMRWLKLKKTLHCVSTAILKPL